MPIPDGRARPVENPGGERIAVSANLTGTPIEEPHAYLLVDDDDSDRTAILLVRAGNPRAAAAPGGHAGDNQRRNRGFEVLQPPGTLRIDSD